MNAVRKTQDVAIRVARDALGQVLNPFRLPDWFWEFKKRSTLKADILAGLTVALVLIPQSMAYAQLAGLPAHYGLYASLLPPMIAAFFGSSRQLATGPVAMVSLMTAAALEPLATAGSEAFIGYAFLLSLMVGLFQLLMGMFRLGVLLNFLSHPVVLGFVNAAAIIIATSQLGKIFGVAAEKGEHHYEFVLNTIEAAWQQTHWPTLFMAMLAFTIMVEIKRYRPKWPYVLVAVVTTTVLAWALGFEQHRSVNLDQIANNKIRVALVYDVVESRRLANLNDEYIAAQKTFGEKEQELGEENEQLLTERQQLELIRFRLQLLTEQVQMHRKGLYKIPLYAIGPEESPTFYTREELQTAVGSDSPVYGQSWSIRSYKNDVVDLQAGGQVIGTIPRGLPGFRLPKLDWAALSHLIGATIAISLIGFMEAISIARALAARTRQNLNADRELIGQGLGNIFGSFFQAYPSSGSFSRSAVNYNAGGQTGFSSVVTVVIVAFTLLALTPLLYYLPQATLAAVIMMAVAGLVSVKPFIHAWQTNRHDGFVATLTFVLTLALAPELEMGILVGMLLSLILLLFRIMKPRVVFPPHPEYLLPPEAVAAGVTNDRRIVRMRFEGSLVFANVAFFEEQIQKLIADTPQLRVLIIDGVSINEVDASGEEMLRENYKRLIEAGIYVLFVRFKTPIMQIFKRSHMYDDIERKNFYRNPNNAFARAWNLLVADEEGPEEKPTEA
ncbi:MAG: SulP family inorganic anion transporter [Lysobacterales bacterium]